MRRLIQSIDLSALSHNATVLSALAPNSKTVAVVKADVYGCGAASVRALSAVDYFAVSNLEEALAIRQVDAHKPIVLLEGWFESSEVAVSHQQDFIPVITTLRQVNWLMETELAFEEVWLKVDTGMTRLGFLPDDIDAIWQTLQSRYAPEQMVLMSHFSSADEDDHVTQAQLARFDALNHLNMRQCIANSAGTIGYPHAHRDIVRFGIALYGASPLPDKNIALKPIVLKPVVTLTTEVISVKHCPAGSQIGYGHTATLDKPSHIAVIAVGYADGYPREYIIPPPVWVNGKIYRVIGRISMDMMTVEVDETVSVGDSVELWGNRLPIETVAKDIGTIPYVLLVNMATRVHREEIEVSNGEI